MLERPQQPSMNPTRKKILLSWAHRFDLIPLVWVVSDCFEFLEFSLVFFVIKQQQATWV